LREPGEAATERYRDQTLGKSRMRVGPDGIPRTRLASSAHEGRRPLCATNAPPRCVGGEIGKMRCGLCVGIHDCSHPSVVPTLIFPTW